MCGIFGVLSGGAAEFPLADLIGATNSIRSRGPDDEGYCLINTANGKASAYVGTDSQSGIDLPNIATTRGKNADLGFGFRRLSIQDTSVLGHQPMASSDGDYWLVFNGEVYNFPELREELKSLGFSFRSNSDTEVVLNAYHHWGEQCFSHFNGMWALALYDNKRKRLVLSRDPFGIKPLYYCFTDRFFAFGSELKCFLSIDSIDKKVNAQALLNYLLHRRPGLDDLSLIEGIRQFPAAHVGVLDLTPGARKRDENSLETHQYSSLQIETDRSISFDEATNQTREAFLRSVRQHLRSDVEVGITLSGGIDSSSVLMAARHALGPDVPIHTFSFIANEAYLSEEKWIDELVRDKNIVSHKVTPAPSDMVRDLDELIRIQDEPIASLSPYAQYRVFKLAQEKGIKVTLDGQGADEYLAGYVGYRVPMLAGLLRQHRFSSALELFASSSPFSRESVKSLLRAMDLALFRNRPVGSVRASQKHLPLGAQAEYFLDHQVHVQAPFFSETHSVLKEYLHWTVVNRGLPELLRFEDRNSMGFSIESRVPFLDKDLVQTILSFPDDYILSTGGRSKHVFREAMRGLVPDNILDRTDKIGFAVPEKQWLFGLTEWVEHTLSGVSQGDIPALSIESLHGEWLDQFNGRKPYTQMPWRWLNFISWCNLYGVKF